MNIAEELRLIEDAGDPVRETCHRAATIIEELHRRILRINECQRYLMGVGSDGSGPYANEKDYGEWLMRKDVIMILAGLPIPERTYDGDHTSAWVDNGDSCVNLEDVMIKTDEPPDGWALPHSFCGGSL